MTKEKTSDQIWSGIMLYGWNKKRFEKELKEYAESQLKPQERKSKKRPCTCHLKPYSEFTPLEKEYGCYNCGSKPTPPKG